MLQAMSIDKLEGEKETLKPTLGSQILNFKKVSPSIVFPDLFTRYSSFSRNECKIQSGPNAYNPAGSNKLDKKITYTQGRNRTGQTTYIPSTTIFRERKSIII